MSDIKDFVIEDGSLKNFEGTDECVTIPDSVTSIYFNAFGNCKDLKTVIIKNKDIELYESSFDGCYSLKNVYFPNGTTLFEEAFPCEIFDEINFFLCLSDDEYVFVPHKLIGSVFEYDDEEIDRLRINFDTLLENFSKISNKIEKKAFAESVVKNTSLKDKTKFVKFLKTGNSNSLDLSSSKRKILMNGVIKGEKDIVEEIALKLNAFEFKIVEENNEYVKAKFWFWNGFEFKNILELPFFSYENIKCVLWIEETGAKGMNLSVYKDYGSKTEYNYQAFCSNKTFYMEEVDVARPYLDDDFSIEYEDFSTGIDDVIKYKFEQKEAWDNDSCFKLSD